MKCHLKTRDGWMKTIDQEERRDTGFNREIIIIPRIHTETRPLYSNRVDYNARATDQRFTLVMEASVYDHRTNATVREAWYEER